MIETLSSAVVVDIMRGPDTGKWKSKRDARPGPLRGVTEALRWDHDRLEALEEAAMDGWARERRAPPRRLHTRFAFGLLRHIRFEESVLFPQFERVAGTTADRGPTAVMRVEHRRRSSTRCLTALWTLWSRTR